MLFVVNRSATFCEAVSSLLMKRVINHIILSLLYTIIICLIKMHRTTSSSDLCDVENIITWHCVEPKTFSVDQYWSICSLCVIKISIISKIILNLFYYKRHNFNPWSVYVWNHVIHSLNELLYGNGKCQHGYMWTSILVLISGGWAFAWFQSAYFTVISVYFLDKHLCSTWLINCMTRLVFFNNLNNKFMNYQFFVFENDPPRFLYIINWSIITGLSCK